jgi:two-component system cell cycle response regulator
MYVRRLDMDLLETNHTILLIDSDVSLTKTLSLRLSNVSFNVLIANNYHVAIKLLSVHVPDLILLDLVVKCDRGHDLLAKLKSNHTLSKIPVIILSSDVNIKTKIHGLLAGANDYIVKPFRFEELLARMNTQLRILNMQKELELKNKELIEKNILLEKLAITDSLTGLFNRGHVFSRLKAEVLRSARYKEMISFLMIDIDSFKQINDNYGHLAGDSVLKIVSNNIQNSVRDIDIVGRYGGEEFVVVCPNTDSQGALIVAERIREKTYTTEFEFKSTKIDVSVSIGLSSSIPKLHVNIDSYINKQINDADIALYKAKSEGRNRVVVFQSTQDSNASSTVEKTLSLKKFS